MCEVETTAIKSAILFIINEQVGYKRIQAEPKGNNFKAKTKMCYTTPNHQTRCIYFGTFNFFSFFLIFF